MFYAGPGLSFASILTRCAVARRFTTNYAFANGIGHAGSPLGIIVIAPLTQLFIDTYGWRGAMLLLGGIGLHLVVCGALLQPPPSKEKESRDSYQQVPTHCEEGRIQSRMASFKDILRAQTKLFGISVCFRMSFWITSVIFVCNGIVGNLWVIYYVDHIQAKGFTAYDAVTFTTAAGVGSLISKIGHGPLIDKGWLKLRAAIVMLTVVGSLTLLIDPWTNSYWLLMVNEFVYLSCYGVLISLNDILTRELLGIEVLANAFSWMQLMNGILCFCLGFLPG